MLALVLITVANGNEASASAGFAFPALHRRSVSRLLPQTPPSDSSLVRPSAAAVALVDDVTQEKPQQPQQLEAAPLVEPFWRGIARDAKARYALYRSDIVDGISLKALSSIFFLFFGCLAPAVAFGSAMAAATGGQIGSIEMIVATGMLGLIYAAFSAQPLTIIGSTGPVLAFTSALYKGCQAMQLPFLPTYVCIGLWNTLYLGIAAVFSMSNSIKYLTRWTDEIFSLLISVIFMYEALVYFSGLFTNTAVSASTAALSTGIGAFTFIAAVLLSGLRKSPFFNRFIRDKTADFGPTIAVAGGSGLAYLAYLRYGIRLPTLSMPSALTTSTGRPWLMLRSLSSLPLWVRWGAALPALMCTVLLFMDQNITVRLVNSNKHKLKKPNGYDLDLATLTVTTGISSVLGLPWLVAATVRSLNHVRSVMNFDYSKGGDDSSAVVGCDEQRVTGLGIHTLILTSVILFRQQLALLPEAVLKGLFLFLGVSTLAGNEMWQRTKLFVTEPKLAPKRPWTNVVPLRKVHLFTAAQIACLAAVWLLKESSIGVMFPVIIALLHPIRVALERYKAFSAEEVAVLDSED